MCHNVTEHNGSSRVPDPRVWFNLPVEGGAMPVYFCKPVSTPAPTVVILHDIFGANLFYQEMAGRFAALGFNALLPDLFWRQGSLPEPTIEFARARGQLLNEEAIIGDMATILRYAAVQPATTHNVGTIGFCMGGTLAMLAAARQPVPLAVVAYYGFPAGRQNWVYRPVEEAERVASPILAFWGDQDHSVGMGNVDDYDIALQAAGKEHEFHIYPGVPHGFLSFEPEAEHAVASQESWQRTVEFFQQQLGS